jgi:hypothetical protein
MVLGYSTGAAHSIRAQQSNRAYFPRLIALLWITILLQGCSPARESITYTSVREKFKAVPRDDSRSLSDSEKAQIAVPCAETATEISSGLQSFAHGAISFALVWCLAIGVVAGLLLACLCWWLAKRRIVGWPPFAYALLGAWGLAALASWGLYAGVQLPRVRGLVASDWLLRELKQDSWIPGTKDPARLDFTANCVDRIQEVAQGRESCDQQMAAYPPLFKGLPPLPRDPAGTNTVAYRRGLQSRAEDMVRLLEVETVWEPVDRPLSAAAVFEKNSVFRAAVNERYGQLAYLLLLRGLPPGVPAGPIVIIVIVVPLVAVSVLAIATQTKKRRLRKRLEGVPHV